MVYTFHSLVNTSDHIPEGEDQAGYGEEKDGKDDFR